MKLFEEQRPPQDATAVMSAIFREFKEVEQEAGSRYISPSGLNCQVACALKLAGTTPDVSKESFLSRSFADAGEDRHRRIQAFLSKTEYWVDIKQYVKDKKLPLDVVVKVNAKYNTEERPLPGEILYEDIERFLAENNLPSEAICIDEYETLLRHKTLPLRFKCDGLLLIEGIYYVLEIKTEREMGNVFRKKFDEKHQKQGVTYSFALATTRIMWYYEGRDSFEPKFFVQLVSAEEKQQIEDYIKEIVTNRDIPTNLAINKNDCAYCDYKKTCKKLFKESKLGESIK